MFVVCAAFGRLRKAAEAAVNPFDIAMRVALCWLVILITISAGVSAQPVNVSITEYPVPTPNNTPQGITPGSDGAIWFTELIGNKIGRLSPSGGVAEFSLPTPSAGPEGIAAGPDGALWFTETFGGKIGRITTAGAIAEYPIPGISEPMGIVVGSDGALWFADSGCCSAVTPTARIGRITTAGVITQHALTAGFYPFAITAGPDGALWFAETESPPVASRIAKMTTSGVLTEYPIVFLGSAGGIGGSIAAGSDGALWFGAATSGIGRITTSGSVSYYLLPTAGNVAGGIVAGSDGALWFTECGANGINSKIGRITTSGLITEYPLSNSNAEPNYIASGSGGALWFTETNTGNVGRIQAPGRVGVFSHVAAGGSWTTVFSLINNSAAAAPVTVAFHNDDGSALTLPVTFTQQGLPQSTTASSVSTTISPNATIQISTGSLSSTVVGWADVASSAPLGGFAIFRTSSPNSPVSEGTVPLQAQFPTTIAIPYDNTNGFSMGVALANLSTLSANVTATMFDVNGNQLGTQTIAMPGSGHTSFILTTELPPTAGKLGIVQFQATGGIAGLGLRFSPYGTFTSVPSM